MASFSESPKLFSSTWQHEEANAIRYTKDRRGTCLPARRSIPMDRDDLQSPGARRPPRMHRKHDGGGEGGDDDDNGDDDRDDDDDDDDGERSHLRRVCDSYRQYAAFHAARELGVGRRSLRLLSSTASPAKAAIESIFPPHLRPDSPEYRQRSARLRDAAVRNQYFLDCALRHAHQETSQEAYDDDGGGGGIRTTTRWGGSGSRRTSCRRSIRC